MKQNKVTGFWMRFLARIIDFIFLGGLIVLFGWLTTDSITTATGEQSLGFNEAWKFYVWASSTIVLFGLGFIAMPWATKGRTLGMLICRIKIKFENKKVLLSILKRELFFGATWMWTSFLLMVIVGYPMINEFAQTNQSVNDPYTAWETARIAMLSVFTSVPMFIMFGCAISIVVRKGKKGFHDSFSNTTTVWENKFIVIKDKKEEMKSIQPLPIVNKPVEWV